MVGMPVRSRGGSRHHTQRHIAVNLLTLQAFPPHSRRGSGSPLRESEASAHAKIMPLQPLTSLERRGIHQSTRLPAWHDLLLFNKMAYVLLKCEKYLSSFMGTQTTFHV